VIDRSAYGTAAFFTGAETPYCIPLSLVRLGDNLYFHCAFQGRKLELLRVDPRVCVCFVTDAVPAYLPEENEYITYYKSAVVRGTAFEVTDPAQKIAALRALCEKLTPDHMSGFDQAVSRSLPGTAVWGIRMEDATGKEMAKP